MYRIFCGCDTHIITVVTAAALQLMSYPEANDTYVRTPAAAASLIAEKIPTFEKILFKIV